MNPELPIKASRTATKPVPLSKLKQVAKQDPEIAAYVILRGYRRMGLSWAQAKRLLWSLFCFVYPSYGECYECADFCGNISPLSCSECFVDWIEGLKRTRYYYPPKE